MNEPSLHPHNLNQPMSLKRTNTELEKHYFELFQTSSNIHFDSIEYRDKPDIIARGESTVGIEVTSLYLEDGANSTSEQAQKRLRERVISEANEIYRKLSRKNIELSFNFNKNKPIANVHKLATQIAYLAKASENIPPGFFVHPQLQMPSEISSIYLNTSEYENPSWRLTQVHDGKIIDKTTLLSTIQNKERKAACYAPCDSYWLLITIDFFDRAQDQEIRTIEPIVIKSTVFDRIYLFRTVYGHVVELNAHPSMNHKLADHKPVKHQHLS